MHTVPMSLLLTLLFLAAWPALAQTPPVDEPPLPDKIEQPPRPEDAPAVTIRRLDNGDRVEEYRLNGQIYEVRVTPVNGIPYALLDTNGDGRLDRRDTDGEIAPVYYTLYQWN